MFGALDTSASALVAHRTRLEVIAANMANRHTMYDADGNYAPFHRRIALFATGDPSSGNANGVHVKEIALDPRPLRMVYDPSHPHADGDGMVYLPNVDPAMEQINALEASRAYEANITAAEATKNMIQTSLRLLA
jgi:flagellar basal-body rod protein FlgC